MFHLPDLDLGRLEELGRHYEEQGYCILTGLEEVVENAFYPRLMKLLGSGTEEFSGILSPRGDHYMFPENVRGKLARVDTDPELASNLVFAIRPVLSRIIGPVAHVSSTFHAQFKSGSTTPVDHGGYQSDLKYLEVHGAYLLHQDFTGANIPTSPSAMTLWLGMNDSPDWTLRFYPGSHKRGLLCHRWLPLEHASLAAFGEPVDVEARKGTAVIFNSLMLHGTGRGGPMRRVSCDIRFFPSCGFLPTTPHLVSEHPLAFIEEALAANPGETLRAPLLENLVLAGLKQTRVDTAPHSVLNWVNFLVDSCNGTLGAGEHLRRFTNQKEGVDAAEVYMKKFSGHKMHPKTMNWIREQLAPESVPAGS